MKVTKVENPIVAFVHTATAEGSNFAKLAREAEEIGAVAESVKDDLARLHIAGRVYDLPLGFALVVEAGSCRLLDKETFSREYVADGGLEALEARVMALEEVIKAKYAEGGSKRSKKVVVEETAVEGE